MFSLENYPLQEYLTFVDAKHDCCRGLLYFVDMIMTYKSGRKGHKNIVPISCERQISKGSFSSKRKLLAYH